MYWKHVYSKSSLSLFALDFLFHIAYLHSHIQLLESCYSNLWWKAGALFGSQRLLADSIVLVHVPFYQSAIVKNITPQQFLISFLFLAVD